MDGLSGCQPTADGKKRPAFSGGRGRAELEVVDAAPRSLVAHAFGLVEPEIVLSARA